MATKHTAKQQTVLVGVTGGIGAYKACELVRTLMRRGFRVKVVMTEAATRFVTPLTFRTLTREPVATSLWADEPGDPVHHISLAQEADVVVVAPCTANVLAKIAHGRADDLLTTTVLATEAPVVLAPAMNVHMWRKDITQHNVEALRARGFVVVAPASGELACGDVGEGRLAAVEDIADAVEAEARRVHGLAGVRVLVTAGPTYEPIDAVRFIGNRSSGKTGYAIAEEAARRGAEVTLISGPTALPDPFEVRVVRVTTAAEMRDAALTAWPDTDVVIASAAVSDVRPARAYVGKLKKDALPEAIELERNPDVLAELGALNDGSRVVVGFAAETGDPVAEARRKLAAKRCDLVVANDVSGELGFGTDANRVIFVTATAAEELPVMGKRAIARELLDRVARIRSERLGT
ncbi:bifunctional phosphopantothenoylcysteine decarboxylase/phosphopantothenate--cysteine ligase CoaBC [Coriobacteriia bacterium Es71-Z0120]|uniref:bifunctional phosphopantothenoylcysteine decarboxylase/phosphopantothenate--cysteine ligase CoaBC n=1 Tax=Parvivirga hydrogeniphila TaxID=2939460 RepID=UPI0022608977|nr:bifunctional phosphopantothenoylcysteine decarboxylase/phosphopantothenate--cysteine ligase CoaBC [Parvivirga hydrogeniphila]MCL4079710.1 bifunctional phosphopantothenoylcysteine decarboxylase/phosphopantothenate--cysteine ligase CoaBC [Parvivirga hydrogeniphila]